MNDPTITATPLIDEVLTPTVLEHQVKAEYDVAVSTAHRYPRSITKFRAKALEMATCDAEVAASCYYSLSRTSKGDGGSKAIEGPSVRFAEIVANSYGNMKFGARILEVGKEEVVAQGMAHDLESNVSTSVEVRRRITDRNGRRYGADMIAVTCNAACSIALRNAIFKAVPFALAKPIYEQAKVVARGDAKTLVERRTRMLAAFAAMGIPAARIFHALEVGGVDDISLIHMETLIGMHTAIKDGEAQADDLFPDPKAKPKAERFADTAAAPTSPAAPTAGAT